MALQRPVVSLTTDFGIADPFVAIMKAVIVGIQPEARIVDITHDVPPHDVLDAAFRLRCAFAFFPHGSVHVVVVDPGVGSRRRPLLMITENHRFVAPDNGVLSLVGDVEEVRTVYHMTAGHYFRPEVSATFHGRDVFAPAAAWLTRGVDPENLGEPVEDWKRLSIPPARITGEGTLQGVVLAVDRFGNVSTCIPRSLLEQFAASAGALVLEAAGARVGRQVEAYHEIARGETAFLVNSAGLVEIAANQRSAARDLGLKRGDKVEIKPLERMG
jgi:S-adenosylmethionine hydrolase